MQLQPFARQRPLPANARTTNSIPPMTGICAPWEGPSPFRPVLSPVSPAPTLATVVTAEKLKWHFDDGAWRKGHAPGNDGIRPTDLSESEAWDICRELAKAIHRGAWGPHAPRCQEIAKGDNKTRTLQIRDLFDRVVSATVADALSRRIKPLIPRYVGSVHGGVPRVLLLLQRAPIELSHQIVGQDDIQQAFDCVAVADCVRDFSRYIKEPRLQDLIEQILVGHRNPQSQLIGIAQGDALSPLAMELRLHTVLDLPEQSGRRVSPLPIRYVDNLFKVGGSVSSVTEALADDERRLQQAGLSLKHADGQPRDVRESPVDLLGFRVVTVEGQVQFRLKPDAYDCLRKTLEKAHQRPDPRDSARNKILGWIASHGPVWRNADKSKVISHIRRTTSQSGFASILQNQEIRQRLDCADQTWTQKTSGASLATLLGDPWR